MINNIKTITNKDQFNTILQKFFMNSSSYIKSNTGNIEVKFLSCDGGHAVVKMPMTITPPDSSLIFTRHDKNIIFAFLKFTKMQETDTFIFDPIKFQIVSAERKDRRIALKSTSNKDLIYATNVISDYIVRKNLESQTKKLKRIREIVKYNQGQDYSHMLLYFCDQDVEDPRMKYLHFRRAPLFIPDIRGNEKSDYVEYYLNNIYKKDDFFNTRQELISEISVPFYYNKKVPFGYVQVNNNRPFVSSTLTSVKRIAVLVEKLGRDFNLFSTIDNKILVSDVSQHGLGIAFNDKNLVPIFKEHSYASIDLILPKNRTASLLTKVMHLEILQNNIIKAGFVIVEMDKISTLNYERFIKNVSEEKKD